MLDCMKKLRTIGTKIAVAVMCITMAATPIVSEAAGAIYQVNNVGAQNYTNWNRWPNPVKSYLVSAKDNTLMRVQAGSDGTVVVEYYNAYYQRTNTIVLEKELPLFGAFYEYGEYYYLVTGQENPDQDNKKEVYRITKYNKNWERMGAAGLQGANTTVPFRAGSCRLAGDGKYLIVRTCHEMYKSSDGLNHQANVTIEVDTETMQVTDSFTSVMNSKYGYVSHSFNQFVAVDNHQIVAVDHGDAYPRSVALLKYPTDVTTGKFQTRSCQVTNVLNIPGSTGANDTGVMLNAFQVGQTNYMVAGSSVVQDSNNTGRSTYNVFVHTVNKSTNAVTEHWLTNYAEGEATCSNPQMVKLATNLYLILWTRVENSKTMLYYTMINENAEQQGQLYSVQGALSDCVPLLYQGAVIWYTDDNKELTFHEIKLASMSYNQVTAQPDATELRPQDIRFESASIVDLVEGREAITARMQVETTGRTNVEYSWYVEQNGGWSMISDWKTDDASLVWAPANGDYNVLCKARIKEAPDTEIMATTRVAAHNMIKGKCQMPYTNPETGEPGYLIGVESYENPNQEYLYEMLILDCTLLAEGKDAWIYTTGKFPVTQGNAGWTIWSPQYGYYWTLFRVYDKDGNMLDEACYGFVNAY